MVRKVPFQRAPGLLRVQPPGQVGAVQSRGWGNQLPGHGKTGGRKLERKMMVLLDFSMSPLGKGESVAPYVARCLEIVAASGLDYRLHAMGTTLEGDWDEVFAVVRRCFEALRPECNRISCSIKIDSRKGTSGRLQSKVQKVQSLVG